MEDGSMNFDEILDELGELGRFQITTYFLVCLPVLFSGANSLSYVFTAGVPNYRCNVPACDDGINPTYNVPWLTDAIPGTSSSNGFKPEHCQRYIYNGTDDYCNVVQFSNQSESCTEWVFDEEITIVNEFNITCDENLWKLSFVGNSHFFGIFVGSFLFGVLSDNFGRKTMFIVSIMIMWLAGIAHIAATTYYTFVGIVFVHAVGTAGVYPLGFVIGVELVGRKKREVTGIILNFFYALGEAILAVIAWYFENWRWTQLVVSAPCILFIFYWCLIPESVRWLMAKKKNEHAKTIVEKAAKINKVVLSKQVEDAFKEDINLTNPEGKKRMMPMIKQVFHSKVLIIRFLIVYYTWIASAFIFYGLSLNATTLVGNKYLNFVLVSLIEIPGYCIAWVAIIKLGRKISLIISYFVCSMTCMSYLFVTDYQWLTITLYMIGKLSITSSFGVLFVYTSEMFPTAIRGAGVSSASTIARLGALMAPTVPLLGIYYWYLPMTLFSIIAILAVLLAFKLPETVNRTLPETIEESLSL